MTKQEEENEKLWKLLRKEQLKNQVLESFIGQLKLTIERMERERNEHLGLIAGHLHTIEKLKVKSNLFG